MTTYENYQQYCMNRLPCGVCTRTNSMCPLQNTVKVTWGVSSNLSSDARKEDLAAKQILADITGMTVDATTDSLTTRFIFGKHRTPPQTNNEGNDE